MAVGTLPSSYDLISWDDAVELKNQTGSMVCEIQWMSRRDGAYSCCLELPNSESIVVQNIGTGRVQKYQ